jgi:uncharacterized ferritin-like protein (DUF455 family)
LHSDNPNNIAIEASKIIIVSMSLRKTALATLQVCSATEKCAATLALPQHQMNDAERTEILCEPSSGLPGRGEKPELVYATQVKFRSMATVDGRAALIHALAHIELNAVNIALDAIWRFPDMPARYYSDWLSVAADEARHFSMLRTHLETLGYFYGDFSAHNGLWDMVEATKHDVLARMALVPRTLEARGLDASPQVRNKLRSAGDRAGADIVSIILRDEIGHVAIGNHWYNWLCDQRSLDPISTFAELATKHRAPKLIGPFNIKARRVAGFSEEELKLLQAINSVEVE